MMDKEYKTRKRSNKRARMPMEQRAKIFLSFKALQDDTEESPFNNKKISSQKDLLNEKEE